MIAELTSSGRSGMPLRCRFTQGQAGRPAWTADRTPQRRPTASASVPSTPAVVAMSTQASVTLRPYTSRAGQAARFQLQLMGELSAWLAGRDLGRGLAPEAVREFVPVMRVSRRSLVSARALDPLLDYLGRTGMLAGAAADPAGPQDVLLAACQRYLLRERAWVRQPRPAICGSRLDSSARPANAGAAPGGAGGTVAGPQHGRPAPRLRGARAAGAARSSPLLSGRTGP